MPPLKLTKSNIDKLQFSGTITDYFDLELKGFGLRLGKESKTFFARKEIQGKPIRITIGKMGVWTPDTARDEARRLLHLMGQGVDPRAEERRLKNESRTLGEVFGEYLEHRNIKATTLGNYQRVKEIYLVGWMPRAIDSITRQDVLDRHREITAANGPGMANLAMVTFRAVWNYAFAHQELPPAPPTKVLSVARAWNPENRRSDRLKPAQFPTFHRALHFMGQAHVDGYTLALHTGMRSEEVAGLLWVNVDFVAGCFKVVDTKNGTDLTLPMSSEIQGMMQRRKDKATASPFVFAGPGKGGNIVLQAAHLQKMGFEGLTVHGLRRTFRYLCETLNFPTATIKRLMNHSLRSDITDSYLELEVEELRPYVERISAEVRRLVDVPKPISP